MSPHSPTKDTQKINTRSASSTTVNKPMKWHSAFPTPFTTDEFPVLSQEFRRHKMNCYLAISSSQNNKYNFLNASFNAISTQISGLKSENATLRCDLVSIKEKVLVLKNVRRQLVILRY